MQLLIFSIKTRCWALNAILNFSQYQTESQRFNLESISLTIAVQKIKIFSTREN